ncbi:uncharacterized protein P174DRAFT_470423 [Aspergillus novofumigatus IBT 16806]|uniref:S-adenosyl-L-methionine-dependent methyltransferase n=1 Tax=Aspergillus novofumigatus (strain IBT 16806) TaxID=1392255 RepID=A0A2I1BV80_ASPN1|nr:S-adenosyl-L-methionine-dependent methyltransferase [Aspergillus novofumigatus IBT 16806]PKX89279.1 S-adenosyl-L-methionine-dependent methyltransferase [Aspergillus novofumigatus IBT 16806]
MEVDAATLFNALGERYEDAYADSPGLLQITEHVVSKLPRSSHVLDVGCGTGKPVAAALASAGHTVYGIDVAENMVRIAASQVNGTFSTADMRTYTPPVKMDAVFAIYSLFQIQPSDTHKVVYRFAEWLKEDGILVLGVTPSSALVGGKGVHDPVWDCMRSKVTWMERPVSELYLSQSAWLNLLREAGFAVEVEKMFNYIPKDSKHTRTETHYLIVGRKSEPHPLLGPYAFPEGLPGKSMRNEPAWRRLQGHLFLKGDQRMKLSSMLEGHQRVLDIGGGLEDFFDKASTRSKTVETLATPFSNLPYPDAQFDAVIAATILDYVDDLRGFLLEVVRVVDKSSSNPRVILIQAAPYNEVQKLMNTVCTPLSGTKPGPAHQGLLLHSAMKILADIGFGRTSLHPLSTSYSFDENSSSGRSNELAEMLCNVWFPGEEKHEQMKQQLISPIENLLLDHPGFLQNELVILEALQDDH